MPHVENASPEESARVLAGPHRGWATFDEALEGARFQRLHELVSAVSFDREAAQSTLDELGDLARSYGYGLADGFHSKSDGMSDDEIDENPALAHQRDQLEDPTEDDYFTEIRNSERTLLKSAATAGAREFLGGRDGRDGAFGPIHDAMESAFKAGRDERAEAVPAASPTP